MPQCGRSEVEAVEGVMSETNVFSNVSSAYLGKLPTRRENLVTSEGKRLVCFYFKDIESVSQGTPFIGRVCMSLSSPSLVLIQNATSSESTRNWRGTWCI